MSSDTQIITQIKKILPFQIYDMGAVSPGKPPDHAFYGLYRFKSGFGGRIVHRSGSWDYPLKECLPALPQLGDPARGIRNRLQDHS